MTEQSGSPPLLPLRDLTVWVVRLNWVIIFMAFVDLGLEFLRWRHGLSGYGAGYGEGAKSWLFQQVELAAGSISMLVSLAAVCIYFVWQYRVSHNVQTLHSAPLTFSPVWAIIWWFVPIANLIQPPRIVAELYRETVPGAGRLIAPIILVWWLLVLSVVGGDFWLALAQRSPNREPGELFWYVPLLTAAFVVAIVCAIIWVERIAAGFHHLAASSASEA